METLELPEVDEDVQSKSTNIIVIYNDDINTFYHVINCLVKYCNHSKEQAEQCTMIIHYNGKCDVKNGTFEDLVPIKQALNENGIDARIE